MKSNTKAITSVWMETESMPAFDPLEKNVSADVCVIGGGIAGITSAYLLQKEGLKVILIECGSLAGGETGRTTAHLSSVLDDRFHELEKIFNQTTSRLAYLSHSTAIDKIQELVVKENIKCDFTRLNGYLFLGKGHSLDELEQEYKAALRAGFPFINVLEKAPISTFNTGTCLEFPNQAQFHVVKYLKGLIKGFIRMGGQVYTHTKALEVKDGDEVIIKTENSFEITAKHAVVATNTPFVNKFIMHTKQAPYTTYVHAARIPKNSLQQSLYWDIANPYHYVRLQPENEQYDLLIIGGEDHKTGQESKPEKRFAALKEWGLRRFTMIKEFAYKWSGQVMEPVDSLGYMGKNPGDKNIYIITGDSGHGMTHTTIGAMIITDLINKRPNPWADIYDPERVSIGKRAVLEYVKENLNVAEQFIQYIVPEVTKNVQAIPMHSGAILDDGFNKIAVYRDETGISHEFSAKCTHLGCIVQWNDLEKSWECPCHGSKFNCFGKVTHGPANQDLQEVIKEKKI